MGRDIRTIQIRFNGSELKMDKVYDSRGRLEKTSLPFKGSSASLWNVYKYDSYNRPVKLTHASGKIDTWVYGGNRITTKTEDISTTKTYNARGQLVFVSDPGGSITYNLRPDGQPALTTVHGNIVTTFGYDEYGRRTSIDDPSAGLQTFSETYINNLLTATATDATGKTITSKYDQYGKLMEVTRPEFTTSYEYYDDGLLEKEVSDNGTSALYTYDGYGRVSTERENAPDGKWLQKTYSYSQGNLQSTAYKSQSEDIAVENYYYTNGHLTEIKLNGQTSVWKLNTENDLGLTTKVTTGNIIRDYGYAASGLPTSRKASVFGDASLHHVYNFDPLTGNLNYKDDYVNNSVENFTYDNLNRLTNIAVDPGYASMYNRNIAYAPNGNINNISDAGYFEYNDNKPYQISTATPNNISQLEQYGDPHTISYTSFQRPAVINQGDYTTTFTYNAMGDRVKMYQTHVNGGDLAKRYYLGSRYESDLNEQLLYLGGDAYSASAVYKKENNTWNIYYICRDYLGSICAIIDSNGQKIEEYSYDAWGRMRDPQTLKIYDAGIEPRLFLGRGYTGHEHLKAYGLINMNARLYDPVVGRFLSPDPYVSAPDFTQSFNRYSYALNNPLKYTDPDGENPILVAMLVGATINGLMAGAQMGTSGNGSFLDGFWRGALVGAATGALASITPLGGTWGGSTIWGATVGTASSAGMVWASGGNNYSKIWHGTVLGGVSGFIASENFVNYSRGKGFHSNNEVLRRFKYSAYNESYALDYNWRQEALDYFGFDGNIDLTKIAPGYEGGPGDYFGFTDTGTGDISYGRFAFRSYNDLKATYYKELYHSRKILNGIPIETQKILHGEPSHYRFAPEERLGFISQYKNQGLYPRESNQHIMGQIEAYQNMTFNMSDNQQYSQQWWHFIYKLPRRW